MRLKEALRDNSAILAVKFYIVSTPGEEIFFYLGMSFYVKQHLVTMNTFYIYCNVTYMWCSKCVIQILLRIFCKI